MSKADDRAQRSAVARDRNDDTGVSQVSALRALLELATLPLAAPVRRAHPNGSHHTPAEASIGLATHIADIVMLVDADRLITWISPSVRELSGWSPTDVINREWDVILHPDDIDRVRSQWEPQKSDRMRTEIRMRSKRGEYRWYRAHLHQLTSGQGHMVVVGLDDIHDEVSNRIQRQWSEVAMRRLFDDIADPITVWRPVRDANGVLVDLRAIKVNRAFDDEFSGGFSTEGRLASACAPETLRLLPRIREVLATDTASTVAVNRGERRLHLHISQLANGDVIIVSRDVSDVDAAGMERANQVDEEAEHLARVAHTLRTNLSVVQGWIDVLDDVELAANPELSKEAISNISRNTRNLISTVNVLMQAIAPAGRYALEARPTDIAPTLTLIVNDLRATHRELAVEIECPNSLYVRGNTEAIDILVRHLLENAARFARARIVVQARLEGEHVLLEVLDDGPGIADDVELFRPFTPNHRGNGNGVGLSVVHKLVEAMDGQVNGENRADGPGARFEVRLPAVWPDHAVSSSR